MIGGLAKEEEFSSPFTSPNNNDLSRLVMISSCEGYEIDTRRHGSGTDPLLISSCFLVAIEFHYLSSGRIEIIIVTSTGWSKE